MSKDALSKEELVRLALAQLGDVPAPTLAAFIEREHGVKIDTKFLPFFKASLRGKEHLEQSRAKARAASGGQLAPAPTQAG